MTSAGIMAEFPEVQWYDYTKNPNRLKPEYRRKYIPANYHLTFSRSESNEDDAQQVIKWGGNVAMVFDHLPKTYWGCRVVDGDQSDARFLDGQNVIVGLVAKGRAKQDKSGFVISAR